MLAGYCITATDVQISVLRVALERGVEDINTEVLLITLDNQILLERLLWRAPSKLVLSTSRVA